MSTNTSCEELLLAKEQELANKITPLVLAGIFNEGYDTKGFDFTLHYDTLDKLFDNMSLTHSNFKTRKELITNYLDTQSPISPKRWNYKLLWTIRPIEKDRHKYVASQPQILCSNSSMEDFIKLVCIQNNWIKDLEDYDVLYRNIGRRNSIDRLATKIKLRTISNTIYKQIAKEKVAQLADSRKEGEYSDPVLNYVDWNAFSSNPILIKRMDLVEKYKNNLRWNTISSDHTLTDEFLSKYENLINWGEVSRQLKISDEAIIKYKNKIIWKYVNKTRLAKLPRMLRVELQLSGLI